MHIQDMTWAKQENKSTSQNTNMFNFNSEQEQKQKIAEICWPNDRLLSKITPRLQADSKGKRMTLLGIIGRWMVGL